MALINYHLTLHHTQEIVGLLGDYISLSFIYHYVPIYKKITVKYFL